MAEDVKNTLADIKRAGEMGYAPGVDEVFGCSVWRCCRIRAW